LPQNFALGFNGLPHLVQNRTVVCLLDGDSCWTGLGAFDPFFMKKTAPITPPTATAATKTYTISLPPDSWVVC